MSAYFTYTANVQIILAFGNYMNSSRRGAVYGFKLESLGRVGLTWIVCIIACTVEPLYIAATLGEHSFGRYKWVAFIEGLFCTQTVRLGPGFLAVIQRWSLFRGGR